MESIRYQNQPTLVYTGKKFFQLAVQQRNCNLNLLQVCRSINSCIIIYSPSVKTGTKHSLQTPLIHTEIMEIGSTRKHGKVRMEKMEEKVEYGLTPGREDIILKE